MDMLRIMTAGSVDDGKSTLIGRLLYDSHVLLEDQLNAVTHDDNVNLAFVTDGLKAEREQGITIDVAYRYFSTAKRKFILADAPGHVQYTRNMVTAATASDVMLLMIDAQNGLVEQTKRHLVIASVFGIDAVIVCVNKMDLVEFREDVFNEIVSSVKSFVSGLRFRHLAFVPISALRGDNVVHKAEQTKWYAGLPLLDLLGNVSSFNRTSMPLRVSVQNVVRFESYRGVGAFVWSGNLKVGDRLKAMPQNIVVAVTAIDAMNGGLVESGARRSCTLQLSDFSNIERGSLLVPIADDVKSEIRFEAICCWLHNNPLAEKSYLLRVGTLEAACKVTASKIINVHNGEEEAAAGNVDLNDIARVAIQTSTPVPVENYYANRFTGSAILIDVASGETVAAVAIML